MTRRALNLGRTALAVLVIAAALAGCERQAAEKAPAPPPAPAAPAPPDETQQTAAGAEAFVQRIYRELQGWANAAPESDARPPERARIYDKSTLDLLAQSEKIADGDLGPWDADPMCECQDPAGMTSKIEMKSQSGAAAVANVTLNFGPKVYQELTLDLVYEDGRWRVHDIQTGDLPTARESLTHYIKEMGGAKGKP